ncbi:MAG: glycosyltransferase family 9 protein, partial [Planctomycetota bacterium]
GNLLTHRVIYNPYLHTSLHYLTLVDALLSDRQITPLPKFSVPPVELSPPRYDVPGQDTASVAKLLDELLPRREKLVLLNPNASDMLPLRRWDGENFIDLAKRLVARDGVSVAMTGGKFERAAVEAMAERVGSDRCVSVAGRTSLRELFALYNQADALVTNDSGPGHFASLTPIKAVVLFGPETPLLYGPLGDNVHVVWSGLACSPCVSALNHRFSPCDDNVCMQSIDVGHVEQVVLDLLAGTTPGDRPLRSPVPTVSLPVMSTRPDVATR